MRGCGRCQCSSSPENSASPMWRLGACAADATSHVLPQATGRSVVRGARRPGRCFPRRKGRSAGRPCSPSRRHTTQLLHACLPPSRKQGAFPSINCSRRPPNGNDGTGSSVILKPARSNGSGTARSRRRDARGWHGPVANSHRCRAAWHRIRRSQASPLSASPKAGPQQAPEPFVEKKPPPQLHSWPPPHPSPPLLLKVTARRYPTRCLRSPCSRRCFSCGVSSPV